MENPFSVAVTAATVEVIVDTVRITYFKNKSDALKWENPESYSYIFLDAE